MLESLVTISWCEWTEEAWDECNRSQPKILLQHRKSCQHERWLKRKLDPSINNHLRSRGLKEMRTARITPLQKLELLAFTKSVALELGSRNIRSMSVAPGFYRNRNELACLDGENSPQAGGRWYFPMKAWWPTLKEVANACVFLGSDMSSLSQVQVLQWMARCWPNLWVWRPRRFFYLRKTFRVWETFKVRRTSAGEIQPVFFFWDSNALIIHESPLNLNFEKIELSKNP